LASVPQAPRPLPASGPSFAPFPDPGGVDPALAAFLAEASSLLLSWCAGASSATPLPTLWVPPPAAPQATGLPPEVLLGDLQRLMEGSYNPHHPGALAHLDPPPLMASVVGDLIAAGLNNNLLAEELSPSLSRLERSLCAWLAVRLGLPPGAGGVPASGGSLSSRKYFVFIGEGNAKVAEQILRIGFGKGTRTWKNHVSTVVPREPLADDG
jgi:hypothetical protein